MSKQEGKIRAGQKYPYYRCTEEQRSERIEIIMRHMRSHPFITNGELKKFIQAQFGIQWRHAVNYIARARKAIKDQCSKRNRGEVAEVVIGRMLAIVEAGTNREASRAAQVLKDIFGLSAPTRIEQSGPNGGPIITKDETPLPKLGRERIRELLTELQERN